MDRSSSLRNMRSERISRSPYARPEQKATRSLHLSPVSAIKSIMSYVTMPFKAPVSPTLPSTNQDVEAAAAASSSSSSNANMRSRRRSRSESGSEDGWNGAPPATAYAPNEPRQQDVFSPQSGEDEDGPEDRDNREDMSRAVQKRPMNGNTSSTQNVGLSLSSRFAPSHRQTRSMAQQMPIPTSAAYAGAELGAASPGVVALTAWLNAKTTSGEPVRSEDYPVIDVLTQSIKTESATDSPPRAGGSSRLERLGGWSAGAFSSPPATPRKTQSLRASAAVQNTFSTPQKPNGSTSASSYTPGPIFSPGVASTPNSVSRGKVVYLGVGMSAKRKYGTPTSGIRPLFDPTADDALDTPAKKRRTEGQEEQDNATAAAVRGQDNTSGARQSLVHTVSSPALRQSTQSTTSSPARQALAASSSRTIRPSPLAQSTTSQFAQSTSAPSHKKADAIAAGKRSASAILTELIEQEEILLDETPAQSVIINPYERSVSGKDASVSDESASQKSLSAALATPGRSNLRASTSSPMRGAAAKMGSARGTKVSALERLGGKQSIAPPATESPSKPSRKRPEAKEPTSQGSLPLPAAKASEQPKSQETAAQAPPGAAAGEKRKPAAQPAPEPFKPLYTPELGSSPQPAPPAASSSSQTKPAESFTPAFSYQDTPKKGDASSAPTFSTSFSLAPPEQDSSSSNLAADLKASSSPSSSTPKPKPDAIFLSAKDTALSVAAPALPFYTFTLPAVHTIGNARPSEAVKKAVLSNTAVPTYHFSLTASSGSATFTVPAAPPASNTGAFVFKPSAASTSSSQKAASAAADWTCSLCSCKSPDSAQKCVVCDEPRPRPASASSGAASSSSSTLAFSTPSVSAAAPPPSAASGSAEWVCSLCSCKSPGSAQKCVVCDEPRLQPSSSSAKPAATMPAAPPPPPAAPSQPFTGFGAGFAPQKKTDQWTCSTCMCQNPQSAKDKCQVCEMPR